ncbi:MAG: substrate-binding domain-containing protein [Bacilli bacterium]
MIHLINGGHNRIGVVASSFDGTTSVRNRIRGFYDALVSVGEDINTIPPLVLTADAQSNDPAVASYVERHSLSAIVCTNHVVAVRFIQILHKTEAVQLSRMIVVAFDGQLSSENDPFNIVKIQQPRLDIGSIAVDIIQEIRKGGEYIRQITLPVELSVKDGEVESRTALM